MKIIKTQKKIVKHIESLYFECLLQTIKYDSYFYISNLKNEDGGEYNWFHNTDLSRLKELALIMLILEEQRIDVSTSVKEAKLTNTNIENMNISLKDKVFSDKYDKVMNTKTFEELEKELKEFIDLLNINYGANIEINFYKNAKETLAKVYQIEKDCGVDDDTCLSRVLEEVVG